MPAPIVYFELAGPDGAALRSFYGNALGWEIAPNNMIAPTNTGGIAGGIRQDPPATVLYFGVPSIDETLERIKASGGEVFVPRTVVPGVVTFALFRDPAGNINGLAETGSFPGASAA